MTDEELVARFQDGEEEAFETLVERHKRDAFGLCYRLLRNVEDAHDASQEAFIRVFRGLRKFRGDSSFSTWFYRIVMNAGLNFVRRERSQRGGLTQVDSLPERGVLPDLDAKLMSAARSERLRLAIQKLPPRQRETVVLKVYQELRYTDIAQIMKCSVGTAKANFFHAMGNLRGLMTTEDES